MSNRLFLMGAITGDYIGSSYEFNPTKDYNFPIDHTQSNITDDSILTIAVADAALHGNQFKDKIAEWATKFPSPMGGYGGRFSRWLNSQEKEPYNSWGNGSAMRVSSIGWLYRNSINTATHAALSAACTHNHEEGIKGAVATALAIYILRIGKSKGLLKDCISQTFGYDLDFDLAELRKSYGFDESCTGSVPVAIKCYLESSSWEDAVRLAVSMGGDADTLAAITGAIAVADRNDAYRIPHELEGAAYRRLTQEQRNIVEEVNLRYYSMQL